MFKDIKEAKAYIAGNGIRFIDLKLVDLKGRFRHITIPAENLNEKVMKDGIGFDASNYGYASVEKSDMVFYPDLSTAFADPFAEHPTLSMMANVYVIRKPDNVPFGQYPRNIVNSALAYMRKKKIADEMIIGPEYEFSVFDGMNYSVRPDDISVRLYSRESEWSSAPF